MQQAVDNYLIQVLDGNVEAALPGIDAKTPGNLLDRRALLHQGEQSQIDLIALLQVAVKFEIAFSAFVIEWISTSSEIALFMALRVSYTKIGIICRR